MVSRKTTGFRGRTQAVYYGSSSTKAQIALTIYSTRHRTKSIYSTVLAPPSIHMKQNHKDERKNPGARFFLHISATLTLHSVKHITKQARHLHGRKQTVPYEPPDGRGTQRNPPARIVRGFQVPGDFGSSQKTRLTHPTLASTTSLS